MSFQGHRLEERGGIPKLLVELLQLGFGGGQPALQPVEKGRRGQGLQGMEADGHHFMVGHRAFGSASAQHHKLMGEQDKGGVPLEHGDVIVGDELDEPLKRVVDRLLIQVTRPVTTVSVPVTGLVTQLRAKARNAVFVEARRAQVPHAGGILENKISLSSSIVFHFLSEKKRAS